MSICTACMAWKKALCHIFIPHATGSGHTVCPQQGHFGHADDPAPDAPDCDSHAACSAVQSALILSSFRLSESLLNPLNASVQDINTPTSAHLHLHGRSPPFN